MNGLGAIFRTRALFDPFVVFQSHIVVEELGSDVKLNSVVTSRDGLDIPLNVVVLLSFLDVVNIIDDKKSDKHRSASNRQTLLLSID